MKKILTGLAVATMAVAGIGGGASAGAPPYATPGETIYDQIAAWDSYNPLILLAAGVNASPLNLDKCSAGGAMYTVFFPAADEVFDAALEELDLELDELLADKATLFGLLSLHVVKGQFTYEQLESGSYTNLPSLGGPSVTIGYDEDDEVVTVNGFPVAYSAALACNGAVHFIVGIISPPAAPATPACGANYVGQCPAGTSGSGSGLPKTGAESVALTYAALASLIAGAGVLVIRRRSVA